MNTSTPTCTLQSKSCSDPEDSVIRTSDDHHPSRSPVHRPLPYNHVFFRQVDRLELFGVLHGQHATQLQLLETIKAHFHYFEFVCNGVVMSTPIELIQFLLQHAISTLEKVLLLCSGNIVVQVRQWLSQQSEFFMFQKFEPLATAKPRVDIRAHFLTRQIVQCMQFEAQNCLEKTTVAVQLTVDLLNSEPFLFKVSW